MMRCVFKGAVFCLLTLASVVCAQTGDKHIFSFGGEKGEDFLLDGKPFQLIGGEMHPARIPAQYWRHRIQMAKAMGLNTIPIYIFWNDHELKEGQYDFTTGNRNIGEFLKIAKEEGMWIALRPGPYICGEWDFGGIPTYLLRYPDLKIRTMADEHYTKAVSNYLHELAKIVRPNLCENGGPIIMVQIENEYGSYQRKDRSYIEWIKALWMKEGIKGPFFSADGAGEGYLKDTVMPGVAVGLDSGLSEKHWDIARKMNPGVPIMSAETYPGWLRHFGEADWKPNKMEKQIKWYMDNKKNFSLYVFHGGTNFGFTAGANSGGKGHYEPSITSYDYGAPLDEQGRTTPEYLVIRKTLEAYLPQGQMLPPIPAPIPTIDVPEIKLERYSDLWANLPKPTEVQTPVSFESLGQNQGFILYRTKISAGIARKLTFSTLNDYGLVYVDGKYIGALDRRLNQKEMDLPEITGNGAVLDVLVEGMGHINFTTAMERDRKGLIGDVTLGNSTLVNWQLFQFPVDEQWAMTLPKATALSDRTGGIFKGTFTLSTVADAYIDVSKYKKGFVWINGHNLGRYWDIGPQKRLYCPAPWLKKGTNDVLILDLHTTEPATIEGKATVR